MNKKSILSMTLGLGLVVGTLTMGAPTIVQAHERPAGMEEMQERGDHKKPLLNKENEQEILKLLKIDAKTFKQEKDSGKTLAEIASAHNVSRESIVKLVTELMNQRLDKGVADGHITAEQAAEMKENAAEKAQDMVDREPMRHEGKRGHEECKREKPMDDRQNHQEMLKLLQIDEQTFKQETDSGKTLAEIGVNHNVSRQAIVDLMVEGMNKHIDQGLADGHLTAEKAAEMKAHAAEKAQEMVDGKMMGHPDRPQR